VEGKPCTDFGIRVSNKELRTAWGKSRDDFYVGGSAGLWHVSGGKPVHVWQDAYSLINAIWGSGGDLYAAGTDFREHNVLTLHCDRSNCTSRTLQVQGAIKSLAEVSSRVVIGVGSRYDGSERSLVVRLDKQAERWSVDTGPPSVSLESVVRFSDTTFALGTDWTANPVGTVYSVHGRAWTVVHSIPEMPLWSFAASGRMLLALGARPTPDASGNLGTLVAVAGGYERNLWHGDQDLGLLAAAQQGTSLVAGVVRERPWGKGQESKLISVDLRSGQTSDICVSERPIRSVGRLADGSVAAVGDDGWVFILEGKNAS
jgi:hypothetical protein